MHQIHAKAKKGVEMPLCNFGLACKRPNCVYRHPKGSGNNNIQQKNEEICVAHVLNKCPYGKKCVKKHISEEDAIKLIEKNSVIPCRYGLKCLNEDCLFFHEDDSKLNVKTIKEALNDVKSGGVAVDLVNGKLIPVTVVKGNVVLEPTKTLLNDEEEEDFLIKEQEEKKEKIVHLVFPKSEALLKKKQGDSLLEDEFEREDQMKQYRDYQFIKLPSLPLPKEFERNPVLFTHILDPKQRYVVVVVCLFVCLFKYNE